MANQFYSKTKGQQAVYGDDSFQAKLRLSVQPSRAEQLTLPDNTQQVPSRGLIWTKSFRV